MILSLLAADENLHPAFRAVLNPNVAAFDKQYSRQFLPVAADVSAFGCLDPAEATNEEGAASNSNLTGASE